MFSSTWVVFLFLLMLAIIGTVVYKKARTVNSQGIQQTSLTIGARILGGYAVILILLAVISMVTFFKLASIGEEIYKIAEIELKAIQIITNVEAHQLQQAILLERSFRFGEKYGDHAREQYQHAVKEFREIAEKVDHEIEEGIKTLAAVNVHNEAGAAEIKEIIEHLEIIEREHQDFDNHAEEIFSLLDVGGHSSIAALEETIVQEVDQLSLELEEFLLATVKRTEESAQQAKSDEASALMIISILSLTAIFLGMYIGLKITNAVSEPINEIGKIAKEIAVGNLEGDIYINRNDEIGNLADSFRNMKDALRAKADVATQIAQGDLSVEVKALSKEDVLGQAMVTMKESLLDMQQDLMATIEDQKAGELWARCHPENLKGAYAELLAGVNETLDAVINPMIEGIEIMGQYAKGDLQKEMRELPGKQIALTNGLNTIRQNLQALIQEATILAKAAEEGELKKRGDENKFEGGYK